MPAFCKVEHFVRPQPTSCVLCQTTCVSTESTMFKSVSSLTPAAPNTRCQFSFKRHLNDSLSKSIMAENHGFYWSISQEIGHSICLQQWILHETTPCDRHWQPTCWLKQFNRYWATCALDKMEHRHWNFRKVGLSAIIDLDTFAKFCKKFLVILNHFMVIRISIFKRRRSFSRLFRRWHYFKQVQSNGEI